MRVVVMAVFMCTAAFVPAAAQKVPPAAGDSSKDILKPATPARLEDLFRQLNLFGSWAPNCAQPPSPANPHVRVSTPSEGLVMEEHDIGPGFALNRYSVLTAKRLSGDRVAVEVIFQPGTPIEERQDLILLVHDGTRRTLFNQPEGGAVRVNDGVAVGAGVKTPLLNKCG